MSAALNSRVAVIGCGNLGSALVRGMLAQNLINPALLLIEEKHPEKVSSISGVLKEQIFAVGQAPLGDCDVIILAVKPIHFVSVLENLAERLKSERGNPLIISVAAGIRLEKMRAVVGTDIPLARAMPNIACMVGAGVSAVYCERREDVSLVSTLFGAVGFVSEVLKESELDVVTVLAAGGPAFISVMLEGLTDGAVRMGLKRELAQKLAAQMLFGTAKLLLESDIHPAQLKDMVASPGGTTIEGLAVLEDQGIRSACMKAVEAGVLKAQTLAKI